MNEEKNKEFSFDLNKHPYFEKWTVYTSMVRGSVDVALCPVKNIKEKCQ